MLFTTTPIDRAIERMMTGILNFKPRGHECMSHGKARKELHAVRDPNEPAASAKRWHDIARNAK